MRVAGSRSSLVGVMISFTVTEDDQRAWMEFAIGEQGRVDALRVAVSMLSILVFVIVGFATFDFTGLGIGALVGIVFALSVVPVLLKRSVRRQIDQAIDTAPDGSLGPVTLELTPDQLTFTTSSVRSTWQRRAIRRVAVRQDHAFVMFGPNNGLVVPLYDDLNREREAFVDALNSGGH